ncbi:NADH-quinone oxidoreductase subunit M, partial [Mycolicibacterium vinylchloridicum]|uniref:NADH-quinone oxidoreductase subunit M n=1 Tax=Mycolicibacterium vinylchloridicum TaxID=2736928 RepID=UPI0015CC56B5
MDHIPWLSLLWLLPLAGAGVVAILPAAAARYAKFTGLAVAIGVLVIAGVIATRFDPAGEQFQFVENHPWIPSFGTGYILGLDGIALALVVLTAVLMPLLLIAGWNDADERSRSVSAYLALTLAVEAMVLLALVALDILLFFIFFEAMLIPMYFLIGAFGGRTRTQSNVAGSAAPAAALKFLVYSLCGGLAMLAAVIGLYVLTARSTAFEAGTFDFRAIADAVATGAFTLNPAVANALFLGFLFAFAVKAPLWPLHTWLPGAAAEATPASAVLMMAVMDKVGTFGMLRYCLPLFPDSATYFRPVIIALA